MLTTALAAIIAASTTGGALLSAYYAGKRAGIELGEDVGYDKGYSEASKFARQSISLTNGQQATKRQDDQLTDLLMLLFSLFMLAPSMGGKPFPAKNSSEKDAPPVTK
jgi:hypothetical protein